MTTSTIKASTVRIDDNLKAEAIEILDGMGLSFNGYLNMSIRQLVNQRKIPFDIVAAPDVPTEATRRAMVAAEAKELGLIPDDSPSFNNVDELMTFLDGE